MSFEGLQVQRAALQLRLRCDSSRDVYNTTVPATCLPHTGFAGVHVWTLRADRLKRRNQQPICVDCRGRGHLGEVIWITCTCVHSPAGRARRLGHLRRFPERLVSELGGRAPRGS